MSGNNQKLDLRQSQQLTMTPQLQLSLKMLQFSSLELVDFVEQQVQSNPLLDYDEASDGAGDDAVSSDSERGESDDRSDLLDNDADDTWSSREDAIEKNQTKNEQREEYAVKDGVGGAVSSSDRYDFLENISDEKLDLRTHLFDQIALEFDTAFNQLIASHIVDILDDNGYIAGDLNVVAEALGCSVDEVNNVVDRLQKFDPTGVFARNLEECLSLQLIEKNRFDPMMKKLVQNLPMLGKGQLDKLRQICGVDNDDFEDMCHEIRALNPRPASHFSQEVSQSIVVDIFLKKDVSPDGENEWKVELNNEALPRVLVDREYYSLVKEKANSEHEVEYLAEQLNTANWLVRTLNQRMETILKVSTEIVKQQSEFFEKGIYFLKPLTLQIVADQVGVHESTVGRVTSNKYMMTSRGVFELKFFFSSAISSNVGDDDYSSRAVQHLIKEMISAEKEGEILSDDKLAEMLQGRGIDVARRTVAKYREAQGIGSSIERRRQKKLSA